MTLSFEVDDERVEANPDATLTAEMAIIMSVVRFMNDGLPPILVPSHSVLRIIVGTHNVAASLLLSSLLHMWGSDGHGLCGGRGETTDVRTSVVRLETGKNM